MTVIHERRVHIVPAGRDEPVPRRGRLIGVGVHDYWRDQGAIDWALADSVVGVDAVHLVRAYIPARLDGWTWDPVLQLRDARYVAAQRIVIQAVRRAASRRSDRVCGGSAIAGLPEDVLLALSGVVDLIVMGDDSERSDAVRKITWRVQDRARCPVVCVPGRPHRLRDRPVTVVADERGLPEAALAFAAEAALRHGVGLEVSRAWSALHEPPPESAEWLAGQQEELDAQLADWRARYRSLPVVARIELDDTWLERLRRGSSLLVAPSSAAALLRSRPIDHTAPCPVAIVPER